MEHHQHQQQYRQQDRAQDLIPAQQVVTPTHICVGVLVRAAHNTHAARAMTRAARVSIVYIVYVSAVMAFSLLVGALAQP